MTHFTVIPVKTKSQAQGAWAKNPGKKKARFHNLQYHIISYPYVQIEEEGVNSNKLLKDQNNEGCTLQYQKVQ